ncbi:MAG: transglutaminase-like domain-containing protein [Eubacterium sp.]|nr:transglutaminase-like domain-containing protein [Eubacterium sp.]
MIRRKKKNIQEDIEISEGVLIRPDLWKQEESRSFTLLLKAAFVYLVVMGIMGSYLTSLEIPANYLVINLVVAAGAVFCSFLYYSKLWENLGYILMFFVLLYFGVNLRTYISSGMLSTLNKLGKEASIYFDTSAMKQYAISVEDQYLAVTVSMCYTGWVACVLMNVFISRRMQYFWITVVCFFVLFFPMYVDKEPGLLYVIMLLAGILTCFAIHGNGHYHLTRSNQVYEFLPKKNLIQYVYAARTLGEGILGSLLVILLLLTAANLLIPRSSYLFKDEKSVLKQVSNEEMKTFMTLGIMGFFNRYENTGGMSSGKLGGVSSINLDYETDLTITYLPYDNNRFYLKNFEGAYYMPQGNYWRNDTEMEKDGTSKFIKSLYDKGEEAAAMGRVDVVNVASVNQLFLPYYSQDVNKYVMPYEIARYTFYQYFDRTEKKIDRDNVSLDKPKDWLEVPEQDYEAVSKLCQEAGLKEGDTPRDMTIKLTAYFQENIPYTTSPGATPEGEDFVEYFLEKNRKGYCAHFASAATLAFRHMGVPARYVEGYAIDPSDISEEGKAREDLKAKDYYKGYKPVNNETVVSVDVLDADAHAWCEIYDSNQGWMPADVTPYSTEEEGSQMSLIQRLMKLFNDSNSGASQTETGGALGFNNSFQTGFVSIFGVIAIVFAFGILVFFLIKPVKNWRAYARADENDRLLMTYGKKLKKWEKTYPDLKTCQNYRSQVEFLQGQETVNWNEDEAGDLIELLEKAGFSGKGLEPQEIQKARDILK